MDQVILDGVLLTPLKIIHVDQGNVMHALKKSDSGYVKFGEIYISTIHGGAVKAWKKHLQMTMNLVVPSGRVKFVLYDDRPYSSSTGKYSEFTLSPENYQRLTVPAKIWFGFKGLYPGSSLILNIADIEHSPNEIEHRETHEISYSW